MVRILFCFDPRRSSILLVAGDKAGQWNAWYAEAIPLAEQRYKTYLVERGQEEGGRR
nr:type II toxin-antitoxin system RelE/ParE family toxin [Frankia sp. Cas3]